MESRIISLLMKSSLKHNFNKSFIGGRIVQKKDYVHMYIATKQKHLGCKKSARPRSNMQAGRCDQKL